MSVAFPPLLVKSRPSTSYLEARDTNPSVLLLRLRSTLSKEPKLPRQESVRRIAGRDLRNNRIHLPGIRTSQHTPSEGVRAFSDTARQGLACSETYHARGLLPRHASERAHGG
ncbi:hypothetical protein DFP72DRAFT_848774 [Ephemerocybe angulata]|uniref:Uncharacterized protein n=1 Tax=Ephemerocybe angulata TaxID=980116 RepID=A0A8H6HV97_9AGAR|nr:hypothetical protein DFP72DRAFT_848774 [Tulosesus angulatus]